MRIAVKVQPKSRRPGVGGTVPIADRPGSEPGFGARLCIAVAEPAEEGRANRAVCAALARALDLRADAVSLVAGAGSRDKVLYAAGDPAALAARLARL